MSRWFIVGGASFIGSHFTDRLLATPGTSASRYMTISPPAANGTTSTTAATRVSR